MALNTTTKAKKPTKKELQDFRHFCFDSRIIRKHNLTFNDCVVLHKLICLSALEENKGKDYDCFASLDLLKDVSKYMNGVEAFPIEHKTTVIRALRRLEKIGLVEILKKGSRSDGATTFKLHVDEDINPAERKGEAEDMADKVERLERMVILLMAKVSHLENNEIANAL